MNNEARAYREIFEILTIFPIDFVALIPMKILQFFCDHMDREYECHFEPQTFDLSKTLEETKAIFTALFIEYWATDEQSKQLLDYYHLEQLKLDTQKEKSFSTSDILKKLYEEKQNHD